VTLTNHTVDPSAAAPVYPQGGREAWRLVERAQRGDREAFGQIYRENREMVFLFLYRRYSRFEECHDLTAETFTKAWQRIGTVRWQGSDIGAWLTTIARNLLIDRFKSQRHNREVECEPFVINASHANDADASREGSVEGSVLEYLSHVEMIRALKTLTPEQEECLVLRFLRGLSVAEVAQVMERDQGAVKALSARGVRAMRRALPDDFAMAA